MKPEAKIGYKCYIGEVNSREVWFVRLHQGLYLSLTTLSTSFWPGKVM